MIKHKFAAIVVTGLLAASGFAQANSTFPSAAEEGSEYSVNAPLAVTPAGLSGAVAGTPSAAIEGSEVSTQQTTKPRNLERSFAGTFPSAAVE